MAVRPEDIHDEEIFISSSPNTVINAHVDVMEKLGNETFLYMEVDGKEDYTVARIDARTSIKAGENVKLAIDAHHRISSIIRPSLLSWAYRVTI